MISILYIMAQSLFNLESISPRCVSLPRAYNKETYMVYFELATLFIPLLTTS